MVGRPAARLERPAYSKARASRLCPLACLSVAAGLSLTALLACLIPSLRAERTDPAHALRAD